MMAAVDENSRGGYFLPAFSLPSNEPADECYGDMNKLPQYLPSSRCYARLEGKEFEYRVRKRSISIGRNSSAGDVDVSMGKSSFISRNHLNLKRDGKDFYIRCLSKNGIFIDDFFHAKADAAIKLPKKCTLRFPSTSIRVRFTSLVDTVDSGVSSPHRYPINTITFARPPVLASPCPSPTHTISAVNSCPTSPRGHHRSMVDHMATLAAAADRIASEQSSLEVGRLNKGNIEDKPPYSYAQLIVQAIASSCTKHLTLSGIYQFIMKMFPYYKAADKGWQNSIRHNLSLNRYFIKVPRAQDEPGKGSFWRLDKSSEEKLIAQAFRRRRQRGVIGCRASGITSRSAPASPTHLPNTFDQYSRPSSPCVTIPELEENFSAPTSPVHHADKDIEECLQLNSQSAIPIMSIPSPSDKTRFTSNVDSDKREEAKKVFEYQDEDEN